MENKDRLSPKAYEVIDGLQYPPFVGPEENISEFTAKAIVIGALIGAIFGAANAYLGLKVGLTVSASIPAAVMAVAILRLWVEAQFLKLIWCKQLDPQESLWRQGLFLQFLHFFYGV